MIAGEHSSLLASGGDRILSPAMVLASPQPTLSAWLVERLVALGVRAAFGVSGGGIPHLWGALSQNPALEVFHTQHESGAAFAATEASLALDAPVVVCTTTGPGLTNALTGLIAARQEGARVVVLSGVTPHRRRHRGATQESHTDQPMAGLYTEGALFDLAAVVEDAEMLAPLLARLSEGLSRPGGFLAHLGLPADLQGISLEPPRLQAVSVLPPGLSAAALDQIADRLRGRRVAVVVGFEARRAAAAIRTLADRLDALVVSTPRGKGIFSELHPRYGGVVGFAGDAEADMALETFAPEVVLCLGSRLGEGASQWSPALHPLESLIHIHPTPTLLSGPFPDVSVVTGCADITMAVEGLLERIRSMPMPMPMRVVQAAWSPPTPAAMAGDASTQGIHPRALVAAIQAVVLDGSTSTVMAESGNAFAWAIHHLRLTSPRLRVSVGWGSMGHFTCGVIGAAWARRAPVVALVGDGSMLMNSEVATAVRHRIPAIWVVLNDGQYGMCVHGMAALRLDAGVDLSLAAVDFAALARSLGARGERVERVEQLEAALSRALAAPGPTVIDVRTDPTATAPIGRRIQALTWNGPDTHPGPPEDAQ